MRRRITAATHPYLSGDSSGCANGAASPETICETTCPVTGPKLSPIIACPHATTRLRQRDVRPRYGRPSGEQGRRPLHGAIPAKSSYRKSGR